MPRRCGRASVQGCTYEIKWVDRQACTGARSAGASAAAAAAAAAAQAQWSICVALSAAAADAAARAMHCGRGVRPAAAMRFTTIRFPATSRVVPCWRCPSPCHGVWTGLARMAWGAAVWLHGYASPCRTLGSVPPAAPPTSSAITLPFGRARVYYDWALIALSGPPPSRLSSLP